MSKAANKTRRRRITAPVVTGPSLVDIFKARLSGPGSALTDAEFVAQLRAGPIKGEATHGLLARLESRIKT